MSTFTAASITRRDAYPPVRINPEEGKGILKSVIGVQNVTVAGAGTFIKLISVPSNARLHSLEYCSQTLATSSLDISTFYPTLLPGGAASSVAKTSEGAIFTSSFFVNDITGVDGGTGWTNGLGAATTPAVANLDNPLWQMLALTEDPSVDIDIGFSVRTATTEAGYVGLRASYVD